MKKIMYLAIFLAVLNFALAYSLEIDDLINATYDGVATNSLYGNYGAIHFMSGNTWAGTLQITDTGVYFEKGAPATGNLSVELAGHPSAYQTYSRGNITLHLNSSDGDYFVDIKIPDVVSSENVKLYVDDYGATYYDEELTNIAAKWKDDECDPNYPSTYDDGSDNTLDYCKSENGVYTIKHIIPNIYGRVVDESGNPIEGVNISFYNVSFDPFHLFNTSQALYSASLESSLFNKTFAGDFSELEPKPIPDVVTDSNGFYAAYVPLNNTNIVLQHSYEAEYKTILKNLSQKVIIPEINGQTNINVTVTVESASAFLKSNIWIISPISQKIAVNSSIGSKWSYTFDAGTELKFAAEVDGRPWKLGIYNHTSDSKYALIDRLDYDTYRIYFEDLPEKDKRIDWDFNDVVLLVDMDTIPPSSPPEFNNTDFDCDGDGTRDWLDFDDDWCDVGERNSEINEQPVVRNFNAEGHILFSENPKNSNKYKCGDPVYFVMFGVNHGTITENITFVVESHISGGSSGTIVYSGNISKEEERLSVLPGEKTDKTFTYVVPCSLPQGKYDIHIIWDGIEDPWHKIGNFFVEPVLNESYLPLFNFVKGKFINNFFYKDENFDYKYGGYVNKSGEIFLNLKVKPLSSNLVFIMQALVSPPPCIEGPGDEITINAPGAKISGYGKESENEFKINVSNSRLIEGCVLNVSLSYNKTGIFELNATARGAQNSWEILRNANFSSWATEQMARDIYYDITQTSLFRLPGKPANFTGFYPGDRSTSFVTGCIPGSEGLGGYGAFNDADVNVTSVTINYYFLTADWFTGRSGFEYVSEEDGYDFGTVLWNESLAGPKCRDDEYANLTGVTPCEFVGMNNNWYAEQTPFILAAAPATPEELAQTIYDFAEYMFIEKCKTP